VVLILFRRTQLLLHRPLASSPLGRSSSFLEGRFQGLRLKHNFAAIPVAQCSRSTVLRQARDRRQS
jgi:hypothetical protein